MDDESSNSSESIRANWTPPQDHYFVDLLLDQVHRGNKTGQAFTKQAWAEMVVQFNSKFGLKYDLEVLKNRYKLLWKHYNKIKILVGQSGFNWDEARHMVTADDHVWDEYMKVHLDMQPYRTKVVPFYDELCIICGHTVADGRYSLSCFDVGFNSEVPEVKSTTTNDQTPAKDDLKKIDWTLTMDQYFLELMLEQVHKGNKDGGTFKKNIWVHMITLFNAKFGFQYGRAVLKNRYSILRKQHDSVKILLAEKGFCWDDTQHMVIAEDTVWDAYIKTHPSYRMYRNKSVPCYSGMCIICQNEVASGKSCVQEKLKSGKKVPGDAVPFAESPPTDETCRKVPDLGCDMNGSNQHKRPQVKRPQTIPQSKKARREVEGMADAVRQIAVAVTSLPKKQTDDYSVCVEKVVHAVQAIPDVDDDFLLDACDLLEDEKKARMFLALSATLRKKWLIRKLRPNLLIDFDEHS